LIDGEPVAVGEFESEEAITGPLTLRVLGRNGASLELELSDSASAKTYFLQFSSNLTNWQTLNETALLGTGSALTWDVAIGSGKGFWRVQEF
jgi:hypothetical protein